MINLKFILFILFLASGCGSVLYEYQERPTAFRLEQLRHAKISIEELGFQKIDREKVALFPLTGSPPLSSAEQEELESYLKTRIKQVSLPVNIFLNTLALTPQLEREGDVFLQTMSDLSIPDLAISRPLSQALEAKLFLFWQVFQEKTSEGYNIFVEMRLLDAHRGDLWWRVLTRKKDVSLNETVQNASELSDVAFKAFTARYRSKLHRLKFENLSLTLL